MTYKYLDIRRDIYNECSKMQIKKYRSFNDMKKLFKWSYWAILICIPLFSVLGLVLLFSLPNTIYWIIPLAMITVLSVIVEVKSESMYNPSERKKEIDTNNEYYNSYIEKITKILKSHGIVNNKQVQILKEECSKTLSNNEKQYKLVNSKIYDILIGVPLGALISSLIYKNNEAIVEQIICIMAIGGLGLIFTKVIKKLLYFSDGHFKDQFLLNVLNELEYCLDDKDV